MPGVKPHLKIYKLPGQKGSTTMQASTNACMHASASHFRNRECARTHTHTHTHSYSFHVQGIDSLAARLEEHKKAGAVFAKWRSPMEIDEANGQPSDFVIEANMQDLARYALICQVGVEELRGARARARTHRAAPPPAPSSAPSTAPSLSHQLSPSSQPLSHHHLATPPSLLQDVGLVPIVEPDVSMSGTHTLEAAVAINTKIQSVLYRAMLEHGVYMEGCILKSNIVNPGRKCPVPYTVDEIAQVGAGRCWLRCALILRACPLAHTLTGMHTHAHTLAHRINTMQANVDVFRRCMPVAIRSANFLSGGQSLEDASARLSVMNQKKGNFPVNLSFSWSAALQMPLFALCKVRCTPALGARVRFWAVQVLGGMHSDVWTLL